MMTACVHAQSCLTLCDHRDCSLPGSSVPGVFYASGVEWSGVSFPTPGDFPDPEIKPASPTSPALAGKFFTTAPLGKPKMITVKPITISSLHIVTFCVCLIRTPRNLLSWQISSIPYGIAHYSHHTVC